MTEGPSLHHMKSVLMLELRHWPVRPASQVAPFRQMDQVDLASVRQMDQVDLASVRQMDRVDLASVRRMDQAR